jgi:hypothetical protein
MVEGILAEGQAGGQSRRRAAISRRSLPPAGGMFGFNRKKLSWS